MCDQEHKHKIRAVERMVAYVCIVVAMAVAIYWVHSLANEADQRSHKVERQIERSLVQDQLKAEKVCSKSNQVPACRDLFDRLSMNITKAQRHRLGCAALEGLLPNKDVAKIRNESDCPPPR